MIQSALCGRFVAQAPGSSPDHVGFVVDKVALEQVLSEYIGFPCKFSFHRLLHTHHLLSSGAGRIRQLVADVPSGISLSPPHETKKTNYSFALAMEVAEVFETLGNISHTARRHFPENSKLQRSCHEDF
jgi:hypothetical protein